MVEDPSQTRGDLSLDAVGHVADLARLRLEEPEIAAMRRELASILVHFDTLARLDLDGVTPMAHPNELTNRLADDDPVEPMALDDLLTNAPAHLDRFLTVPKVIEES